MTISQVGNEILCLFELVILTAWQILDLRKVIAFRHGV